MTDTTNVWRESHRILSFQSDASGRLAVPALLGFMEEAAGNSAHALRFSVEDLMEDGVSWVLARLRMRFDAWPAWRDELFLETWPSGTDGLRAFREYRLSASDGSPIGAATSVWMVLDLATRKPVRVPEKMHRVAKPERPRELGGVAEAIPRLSTASARKTFRVRWADLDLNRHANHVCYVDWALETVPPELRETGRIAGLDVDFRAEARYDDEIVAEAEPADDGRTFLHRIARAADGRELALLRSSWVSS